MNATKKNDYKCFFSKLNKDFADVLLWIKDDGCSNINVEKHRNNKPLLLLMLFDETISKCTSQRTLLYKYDEIENFKR